MIKMNIFNTQRFTDEEVVEYINKLFNEYESHLYEWDYVIIDKDFPGYEDIMQVLDDQKMETIDKYIDLTILRYLPKCIKNIAAKIIDKLACLNKIALTNTYENCELDIVMVIVDNFRKDWKKIYSKDWKMSLRMIIRHELRHVAQFHELRKRGGGEYVKKALELSDKVGYFDSPIELDAFANQDKEFDEMVPIEEAVDDIVKSFDQIQK